MSVLTTTEKAGYDALVSGAAQAVKKDGSVAFTAAQSGIAAGAAANLTIRTDLDQSGVTVAAATAAALPAYTVSGGSAAGSTLTANANGAFPTLDGYATVTAAASGEPISARFLLHHGGSSVDNGVYVLTQQGSAGAPWIAVRYTGLDTAAKIPGSTIRVQLGLQNASAVYSYRAVAAVTMGTTLLYWWRMDANAGPSQLQRIIDTDFQQSVVSATANQISFDCIAQFNTGAGAAAQVLAANGTASRSGVMSLSTGTTATGRCCLSTGNQGNAYLMGTDVGFILEYKGGVPTLSDGTNTFGTVIGFSDSISALPGAATNNISIGTLPAVGANIYISTSNGAAVTNTDTTRTIVAGADDHIIVRKDPGDNNIYAWTNGGSTQTISTNVPTTTPMAFLCMALKSASTAARTLEVDYVKAHVYWPKGRAA